MKQSIFMRRWIILVLLLMISITFLFLQLLSLKVIDNTVGEIALFSLGAPYVLLQRYQGLVTDTQYLLICNMNTSHR